MALKVDTIQNPSSSTVNLTLDTSGNATVGNNLTVTGTTSLAAVNSSGLVTGATGALYPVVSATAQASTSGTNIDFTGIPSWVKRITVIFNGVSTSGINQYLIQVGTGGTPTTSGYVAQTSAISQSVGASISSTAGYIIYSNLAVYAWSGSATISNVSGNIWVASGIFGNTGTNVLMATTSGTVTLAGVLNFVRITTVGGTDTFDAGSINIQYE